MAGIWVLKSKINLIEYVRVTRFNKLSVANCNSALYLYIIKQKQTMKATTKAAVNKIIFERAYEIENQLSECDFFLAKMYGLKPEQIEDAALRIAVKELQNEFKK